MKRAFGSGKLRKRVQKQGVVWVAEWTSADGKRCRKTLSSDRRVAERMLAAIIRERDLCVAGLAVEDGFDRSAAQVVTEFLADLRSRRTKGYADRVACILRVVTKELRVRKLRDFRPQAFLAFRRKRLEDGASNRTANHELTVTRTLLNWAVHAGYIPFNPLQGLRSLPTGRGYERWPRRALTEDEIARMLAASAEIDRESADHSLATATIAGGTKGPTWNAKPRTSTIPQTPLWHALVETGARYGELVRTTWADLSEAEMSLTLRACTTKSRKERVIPIRRELMDALIGLRFAHHAVLGRMDTTTDLIFVSPRGGSMADGRRKALRRFEVVLARAGIAKVDARGEKVDIHSLRHTAASRLARSGVGLLQAQKLLGHSDPKLTASIYSHLDVEDLRGAVERLPKLARS